MFNIFLLTKCNYKKNIYFLAFYEKINLKIKNMMKKLSILLL